MRWIATGACASSVAFQRRIDRLQGPFDAIRPSVSLPPTGDLASAAASLRGSAMGLVGLLSAPLLQGVPQGPWWACSRQRTQGACFHRTKVCSALPAALPAGGLIRSGFDSSAVLWPPNRVRGSQHASGRVRAAPGVVVVTHMAHRRTFASMWVCQAPREVWIAAGGCRWLISAQLNAWFILRGHLCESGLIRKVVAASRLSKLLAAHLCYGLFQGWGERMGLKVQEYVGQ